MRRSTGPTTILTENRTAHYQLISAYAAQGRRSEALRQVSACQTNITRITGRAAYTDYRCFFTGLMAYFPHQD